LAPAQILGLDQHDAARRRQAGAKARPGDAPADNEDVRFDHQPGVVTV
jgi:hypothetical protein